MRRLALALAALACTAPADRASAQEAAECDWRASAWNLVEPWQQTSRSFANGEVRIALLDTVEPAAAAFWLLILSPPHGELGERQCRIVGAGEGMGFSGIDFAGLAADYDPAEGLVFRLPVALFDPDAAATRPARLRVSLNQSTGDIGVRFE